MAVTVTLKARRKLGNAFMNVCDVAMGTYPTNGEAISAAKLGLGAVDFVLPSPAAGYVFEFDHAAMKLKAFNTTSYCFDGQQGVAGADNTLIKVNADKAGVSGTGASVVIRRQAEEVQNNTNLSGVTVRLIAIGY